MIEFERILDELLAGTTVEINLKITFKPVEPVEDVHIDDELHRVTCQNCGWTRAYKSKASANRGLRTHLQHCAKNAQQVQSNADETTWIRSMTYDK